MTGERLLIYQVCYHMGGGVSKELLWGVHTVLVCVRVLFFLPEGYVSFHSLVTCFLLEAQKDNTIHNAREESGLKALCHSANSTGLATLQAYEPSSHVLTNLIIYLRLIGRGSLNFKTKR